MALGSHASALYANEDTLADELLEVMLEFYSEQDFPFRPGRIECNDEELIEPIQRVLSGSDTEIVYVQRMSFWENIVDEMMEHFSGKTPDVPSLVESGCTLKQIREFAKRQQKFILTRPNPPSSQILHGPFHF